MDRAPFQSAPFLFFIVLGKHEDDEIRLLLIQGGQVPAEIYVGKLSLIVFVIENAIFAEALGENGGDLGDEFSFSPEKENAMRKRFVFISDGIVFGRNRNVPLSNCSRSGQTTSAEMQSTSRSIPALP